MSDITLLDRLNAELYRVADEAMKGDLDHRGIMKRRGLEGVDIYAHPSALMHFKRELEPFAQFQIDNPKKMPRNAIGKYHDCWVFADAEQPEGALIIRLNGNVYAEVLVANGPSTAPAKE